MSKGAKNNTSVDYEKVWRLHRQGLAASVIAERLGCSRRTVNTAIQERREAEAMAETRTT